jgi:hypothetical protein
MHFSICLTIGLFVHIHVCLVLYYCGIHHLNWYSDMLWAGRSGDRILVGARFSAPIQTGPGVHPASYTMGTGIFPGVKWPGRGIYPPPPSSAKVKERVGLYLYSPSGPWWPVLGWTLTLPLSTTVRIWLPNCVVASMAHCACLEAEVADLNSVKWYVQNVFYIYVIVGTRQAMYI